MTNNSKDNPLDLNNILPSYLMNEVEDGKKPKEEKDKEEPKKISEVS